MSFAYEMMLWQKRLFGSLLLKQIDLTSSSNDIKETESSVSFIIWNFCEFCRDIKLASSRKIWLICVWKITLDSDLCRNFLS